jgi:hypothetical protein
MNLNKSAGRVMMKKIFISVFLCSILLSSMEVCAQAILITPKDTIIVGPCKIFIPKTVTPESPQPFGVYSPCLFKKLSMEVYNRWGQLIFESNKKYSGGEINWDISKVPAGVYVYKVNYTIEVQGETLKDKITGNVNVLK